MNRKYGDGKSIIEIVNIGFEPLLTDEEYELHIKTTELKKRNRILLNSIRRIEQRLLYSDRGDSDYPWLMNMLRFARIESDGIKEKVLENKEKLKNMLKNFDGVRELREDREYTREDQLRNINIFESDVTRILKCKDMKHCDDLVSVVTYYTEIFDSIMHDGFIYKEKKFIFYTAGAGQTRNKKSTFISEKAFDENINRLFCGLSREQINELGGMNTNKYLAYTSLSQTNSSIWEDFEIDKAIVVPDIEFEIPNQKTRYIYTETPEDKMNVFRLKTEIEKIAIELKRLKEKKTSLTIGMKRTKEDIEREKELIKLRKELNSQISEIKSKYHKSTIKYMSVKIPFTDGFGVTFRKSTSFMVRMPFMKGLISYVSKSKFKTLCKENGIKIHKIVDIYGKEHHIDKVDYIFTESQFKMYKYYKNEYDEKGKLLRTGWEVYKDNFKKYKCDACRCNIEDKVKLNAKTNYQVLQTLTTEMTDEDIYSLATYDIDNLNGIGRDVQCMLNVLGANEEKNPRMNSFQKSLILYPEMLKDYYVRSTLKSKKESMINKLKSGKFNINGAYTFIIPEPLVCLQWWFNNERDLDKLGMIKEGKVYCQLFDDGEEVDCLRSPHLDHAHCIRENENNSNLRSWYPTKGVYIGAKDTMSKFLMFDNDGDKSLVHNNKTIIKCAKSFQEKYGMIPNYYDMPKANPQQLSNDTLFEGIVMAYHHGNIGTPSNEITKIFDTLNPNSTREEIEEAIDTVALRCVDVNFTID